MLFSTKVWLTAIAIMVKSRSEPLMRIGSFHLQNNDDAWCKMFHHLHKSYQMKIWFHNTGRILCTVTPAQTNNRIFLIYIIKGSSADAKCRRQSILFFIAKTLMVLILFHSTFFTGIWGLVWCLPNPKFCGIEFSLTINLVIDFDSLLACSQGWWAFTATMQKYDMISVSCYLSVWFYAVRHFMFCTKYSQLFLDKRILVLSNCWLIELFLITILGNVFVFPKNILNHIYYVAQSFIMQIYIYCYIIHRLDDKTNFMIPLTNQETNLQCYISR